jgi:hypothetical protein
MRLNKSIASIIGTATLLLPLLSTAPSARAFTASDATTAWNAYNSAFYNSGGYYIKQIGGGQDRTDFWWNAEQIEMAVDRAARTGSSADQNTVYNLIWGFDNTYGHTWTTQTTYNDDVLWACLAHLRAYCVCTSVRQSGWANDAFNNYYILCYGGAGRSGSQYDTKWIPGFYWNTSKNCKNACVEGPGCLVGWYLNSIFGGNKWYYNYSYGCYCGETALYDAAKNAGNNGLIYDSVSASGYTGTADFNYNVGTFLGSCQAWNDTARGDQALYYLYWISGNGSWLNFYTTSDTDSAGFTGIFYRWAASYAWWRGSTFWNQYKGWLYNNINGGWNNRGSNNLVWNTWYSQNNTGVWYSWQCSDIIAAMSAMGPDQ